MNGILCQKQLEIEQQNIEITRNTFLNPENSKRIKDH